MTSATPINDEIEQLDFLGSPAENDTDADGVPGKRATTPWEHTYIRAHRYLSHILKQDTAEAISLIRRRVSRQQYALNKSKSAVMDLVLSEGLAALEAKAKNQNVPQPGDPFYTEWSSIDELLVLEAEDFMMDLWGPIYKKRGPARFQAWAERTQQDPELVQRFLDNFSLEPSDVRQSERDRGWLQTYLGSREEVPVAVIRKAAEEAGIVKSGADWERITKNAKRMGAVGGKHGVWRMPKTEAVNVPTATPTGNADTMPAVTPESPF
jgi:hypothetical protein